MRRYRRTLGPRNHHIVELARKRRRAGLTQVELARRAGVCVATINNIQAGKPTHETIVQRIDAAIRRADALRRSHAERCQEKQRYTYMEAVEAALRYGEETVVPFKCTACGQWHIGHNRSIPLKM